MGTFVQQDILFERKCTGKAGNKQLKYVKPQSHYSPCMSLIKDLKDGLQLVPNVKVIPFALKELQLYRQITEKLFAEKGM